MLPTTQKKNRRRFVLFACMTACLVVSCGLLGSIWRHAYCNQELVEAIDKKNAGAVEYYLQQGADPNMHVSPPGSWVERWKRIFFPKTAEASDTPTVLVASLMGTEDEVERASDHPDITRSLLQHGADVNLKGWGWAPINAAASRGKTRSDVTLKDNSGNSPLSLAAQSHKAGFPPSDPWYRLFQRYAGKQHP